MLYGQIHDQITARLCIEYFTVAHPPLVLSDSPTVQGLVWGVVATWWAGLIIGLPLAIVARSGDCTPWEAKRLVRPIMALMLFMACGATVSGMLGYYLSVSGRVPMDAGYADAVPVGQHTRFIAAAWTHNASYLLGFAGGMTLIAWTYIARCGTTWRKAIG